MSTDPVLAEVRALWEGLAAVPVSFSSATGVSVVVSPKALLCPPGWAGIIALHGQAIVTAPSSAAAVAIRAAAGQLSVADLADPNVLGKALPLAEVLGPAVLAYVDEDGFRPASASSLAVESLPAEHLDLRKLEVRSGDQDAAESGLDEITSPAFAVRDGGELIAAAGYRRWPSRTAHLSVLTAPDRRGQGIARIVASGAVAHALDAGLLPQWRARRPQSRRVARALGFRELGMQLSIRLS
ncbi:GNAT family N-acetyltransferase [Nocardia colli]|uniref:GNAT family N-acetyltransferase n=1 Tax=Nocardia colli TaxID=2545717 RepID=A0A5N0EHH8_9NOCA|nr:GNAT family N-acetyltransferase [Nocardia colli]KAA8887555.1 GNAT family N-acetyltransferase [Nocardia colli]